MYQAYWGLSQSPFAVEAARQQVDEHPLTSEALARLEFLAGSHSRFGLLAGPAGCGKSLVLDEFVRRQRAAGAAAAFVSGLGNSAGPFLADVARQWQASASEGDLLGPLWQTVTSRLSQLRLEQVPAILAIDDLHRGSEEVLLAVERLLRNTEFALTVVASVAEGAVARLGSGLVDLAELRIELAPWTADETRDYLQTALTHAGRRQPTFAAAAAQRLFQLSGGMPRRVNQLAQLALVAGAGQQLAEIDEETVLAVHDELYAVR
ncbi:MAG: ATP-binding protein [Pirellulaceae bacterium]|jgi:ATP/maltotriose-dependent transcriptional regulator MalT|nr:ATP-binding protein [Pirellulaceae bacterium]